jgi:hypothetical protein
MITLCVIAPAGIRLFRPPDGSPRARSSWPAALFYWRNPIGRAISGGMLWRMRNRGSASLLLNHQINVTHHTGVVHESAALIGTDIYIESYNYCSENYRYRRAQIHSVWPFL